MNDVGVPAVADPSQGLLLGRNGMFDISVYYKDETQLIFQPHFSMI